MHSELGCRSLGLPPSPAQLADSPHRALAVVAGLPASARFCRAVSPLCMPLSASVSVFLCSSHPLLPRAVMCLCPKSEPPFKMKRWRPRESWSQASSGKLTSGLWGSQCAEFPVEPSVLDRKSFSTAYSTCRDSSELRGASEAPPPPRSMVGHW